MDDMEATAAAPRWEIANWDFPLHSEILPGLWLGGTSEYDTINYPVTYTHMQNRYRNISKLNFDAVVTLYAWARPADWSVEEMRFGFGDGNIEHVDKEAFGRLVEFAYGSWKAGKRTLIRCQAGLNRSSLVMAFVLIKDGYTPDQAITLMREKRSVAVLINPEFEEYVRAIQNDELETTDEKTLANSVRS